MDTEQADAGHPPNPGIWAEILRVADELRVIAADPTTQALDQCIADLQTVREQVGTSAGHPPNPG